MKKKGGEKRRERKYMAISIKKQLGSKRLIVQVSKEK
jgi:hypothetical protein